MRKLIKLDAPEYLQENAERLTAIYLESRESGNTTRPWQHPEIRGALYVETASRCAYCDSQVNAVAYEHIEHIEPKGLFPEKVVDWFNLTIACPRCNQNKGEYHSEKVPLLNPYVDKPEEHLLFLGSLVFPKPGNDRGAITVQRLRLSRAGLVEERGKRIAYVAGLVDNWARAVDPAVAETVAEFILDDFEFGDFHASVKSYLIDAGFFPSGRRNEIEGKTARVDQASDQE